MKKIFRAGVVTFFCFLCFIFFGVSFAEPESDDNDNSCRTYKSDNSVEEDAQVVDENAPEKEEQVKEYIPSDDVSKWPKYHMKEEGEE